MKMLLSMWASIKAACWHSLSIAWAYVLMGVGAAFYGLDILATLLNDPTINEQFTKVFGADPSVMGKITMTIGAVTAAARARSLIWPKQ